MKSFTALVPLKGHSERVPNKNIRSLGGRPLFAHILQTLSNAPWISEIIVNTDSDHISQAVLKLFPRIIINPRDPSILGDHITMNTIIPWDLKIAKNENILQTHATNPFVTLESLEKARDLFLQRQGDSVFSVNKFQSRFYDENFKPINHDLKKLIPTQDLPEWYEENSCFYFFSKKSFEQTKNRIGNSPKAFVLPKYEAIDIDTEDDFLLAEKLSASFQTSND